jgi:(E)-4-hydroxy-3-methylbut-2-enyl-diphosphate synthase
LGVTEAGEGEDGRIKSAVGIGTLLEDGLGDTIRVSLTEEPEFEIPVAKALADRYSNRAEHKAIPESPIWPINPFEYTRRSSQQVLNIGGESVPIVVADFSSEAPEKPAHLFRAGYAYSVPLDKWNIADQACDYVYLGKHTINYEIPGTLGLIQDADSWNPELKNSYPLFETEDYRLAKYPTSNKLNWIKISLQNLDDSLLQQIEKDPTVVLVAETSNVHGMPELRRLFVELMLNRLQVPVVIYRKYQIDDESTLQLHAATDAGGLLTDGLGDGVWVANASASGQQKMINQTSFGILQAARVRISKTEYISCPSCGRTLFDLQETTARIRKRTDHLKGLKIGIMGCIVNGPGEMADADFGYVGTGVGKITLYKGKEVVKRNVDAEHAVDELIELIKDHGRWVEAPESI